MNEIHLSEKDIARFWSKVDVRSENECWLWKAGTIYGYGKFYAGGKFNQSTYRSHRVAWFLSNKRQIRDGYMIAHAPIVCHNKLCCNPNHLRESTAVENEFDKTIDGTTARGLRHGSKTKPGRLPRGISHPRAKLTEQDVRDVFTLFENKHTISDIARTKSVDRSTIRRILSRRGWTHLEGLPHAS